MDIPQENMESTGRREPQEARLPRLLALQPVTVEAAWPLRQRTDWFYGQLLGLGAAGCLMEPAGTLLLIFHNEGPDLLIRVTPRPEIWANRPRVILEVPNLAGLRQRLADEMIEFQPIQGLSWPDQRVGLWDPSGNRLEIKRLWSNW